jgi:hypothetical protein
LQHFGIERTTLLALAKKGYTEEFGQIVNKPTKPQLKYAEVSIIGQCNEQEVCNSCHHQTI